ncbi:16S rRNA (cytidine(1402)-2'-O)-methyltransferase [Desulforudis sp. DRI-14]|uniref:16S rRNA (cytidine(1402)-2'-O)-methyltransferase n=1 Tax=Desulforudis sp. DRI-14 TaxID=3459793 RepID=UPI004043709E
MNDQRPGTLYLCATPIGNLEDVTLRALRVLKEVDLIAAEDTRQTQKLLQRYGIRTRLISYHAHNQDRRAGEIWAALEARKSVAVVSDAGLPGISDPGALLVAGAVERGIPLVVVPGASAPVTALVASGLRTDRFVFEGFLPRKGRKKLLEELALERRTLVFFESPNRVLKTLEELREVFGERRAAVARELTKLHEEVFRGTLSAALEHFRANPPRGEFTLVVEGNTALASGTVPSKADAAAEVERLVENGEERREAIRLAARRLGMPKREVYALVAARERSGKNTETS